MNVCRVLQDISGLINVGFFFFPLFLFSRECKSGFGKEENSGKADTPGKSLTEKAQIIIHRKMRKIEMEQNHTRLVQTSEDLLQSWRGNCDIQILLYNSSLDKIDTQDIAQVTDYVVAYSCKGNASMKEEREQTKELIMR